MFLLKLEVEVLRNIGVDRVRTWMLYLILQTDERFISERSLFHSTGDWLGIVFLKLNWDRDGYKTVWLTFICVTLKIIIWDLYVRMYCIVKVDTPNRCLISSNCFLGDASETQVRDVYFLSVVKGISNSDYETSVIWMKVLCVGKYLSDKNLISAMNESAWKPSPVGFI